ncbi:MAG: hypothetical protein KA807_12300 [Prolixibacteraceae bacterium]|nr:hypothetical protein [Prolixibacteraceae bacterium]
MKQYLVFMADLAIAPLQGQNPRGGRIENLDEIEAARTLAKREKDKWDLVFVYRKQQKGQLEKIEQYQKGRKYEVEKD